MVSLFARMTRKVGRTHIRYLTPVPFGAATGPVAEVYHEMERDFGMLAPPLALHAPSPPTLAATWLMLRETLLVPGLLGRAAKEAVAAAVSSVNQCPYCVDVHGTTVAGLLRDADARAIAVGHFDDVADPRLQALTRWARSGGTASPGGTALSGGVPAGAPPPFGPAEVPEAIGVAVTFHYINRMVNIFLSDSPLPPVPGPARTPVRFVAARILGRLASLAPHPARSSDLLPEAPLPADLSWAAGQPAIAAAFARASAAMDAAGARSVPEPVRRLVAGRLATMDGPGPDRRAWLDAAVGTLSERDRPAGRLALLAALGSYLVTDALVADFRAAGHGEQALVEVTAWASMAAARSIGDRLHRDLTGIAVDS